MPEKDGELFAIGFGGGRTRDPPVPPPLPSLAGWPGIPAGHSTSRLPRRRSTSSFDRHAASRNHPRMASTPLRGGDGGQRCAAVDRASRQSRDLSRDADADGQGGGVETPAIDDLIQLDHKRNGKKPSNKDWVSKTDPDAKIAKMKAARRILRTNQSTRLISTRASLWRRRSTAPMKATR